MSPEAQRRLGHALQANRSLQTYTVDAPLPEVESLLGAWARMRDWPHPVALVGFVAGDLIVWLGRLMAGVEQAGRGGENGSADCRESEEVGI